ncbi:phage tail protein [Synechococcus elongatus]|uniref:phage tail protein n=1 Tax=Synechococcus elongatus TaxID=32046 RepID=UPI003CC882AA
MNLDRLPIGAIVPWPVSTPPVNWLVLDGSSFSGASFPLLAAALGTTTLPDLRDTYPRSEATVGIDGQESTKIKGLIRESAFATLSTASISRTFTTPSSLSGGHNHTSLSLVSSSNAYGTPHAPLGTGGGPVYHIRATEPTAVGPFVSRNQSLPIPSHNHPISGFANLTSFTHGSGHTFSAANSVQLSDHSHPVSASLSYELVTPNQSVETDSLRMHYIIRAAIA